MRRKFLSIALAVIIGAALASLQALTQQQAPPALMMEKTKDDLYTIIGDGGNVAVLVTNEGVLLIDDKFEQDHDQIVAKVKSVTNQPIKYVISTHYHADHSGGNGKMQQMGGVEIISTANSRKNILEHKQSNAPPNVVPARITFTEETSVFIGGKEVRARYFGRGHTNGDAVIYFPADRTIHTGDLMAGASPLIDYNGGGSLVEWAKTLDGVMKNLDFDTVIPGHGNVTNKAGLQTYRDNVDKLRTRVTGLIKQGKSQTEIAKVMETEYSWAPNSLQQQWSVPGFMKELK
jgi:glyoxylase-like metal-dependent hydrolase (beta-lactamase superfamily II)